MAVFHQAHVDVHARPGLADGDLGRKGDVKPPEPRQIAYNPLGQNQLVGRGVKRAGEEFDLVLLVDLAVEGEVAHLFVTVLDLSAGLCDMVHAGAAEVVHLGERFALVVTPLVGSGE